MVAIRRRLVKMREIVKDAPSEDPDQLLIKGITAFKFGIWGGKSAVLRSQITFYGSADASP